MKNGSEDPFSFGFTKPKKEETNVKVTNANIGENVRTNQVRLKKSFNIKCS